MLVCQHNNERKQLICMLIASWYSIWCHPALQRELDGSSSVSWGQCVHERRRLPFVYNIQLSDCCCEPKSYGVDVARSSVEALLLYHFFAPPGSEPWHSTPPWSPAEGAKRSAAQPSAGLSWGEICVLGWQHNGKMSLFPHLSCGDRQNFRLPWRELLKQGP